MNIENKVFGKLFQEEKVELSSQEYNFAISDDIKAAVKELDATEANVKKAKSKSLEAIGMYNQWAAGGVSRANAVIRLVDELIAKSKELGVEPPQEMVNYKANAVAKSKLFNSNVSSASSASKIVLS